MKNKKIYISLSILAFVAVISAVVSNYALAYQGDATKQGPNYTAERHEAMEKAMADKDYEAWKALMNGRGRVTEVINKDNFAKFVEAHNLSEQGKHAESLAIRQELGLGNGKGQGLRNGEGPRNGGGRGMGHGNCLNK